MYVEHGQGVASDVGACTLPVLQNTACMGLEVFRSFQEYMVLMSRNDQAAGYADLSCSCVYVAICDDSLQCRSDDHQHPALLICQQLL
jgi:hypothetical protein